MRVEVICVKLANLNLQWGEKHVVFIYFLKFTNMVWVINRRYVVSKRPVIDAFLKTKLQMMCPMYPDFFLQTVLGEVNFSWELSWQFDRHHGPFAWVIQCDWALEGWSSWAQCWLLNKNRFRTTLEVILCCYDMFWYLTLLRSLRITDHRYILQEKKCTKANKWREGLNSASQRRFRKTMCSTNRGSCAVSVGSIWMWTAMTSTRGTFYALKKYCDMFIIWYVKFIVCLLLYVYYMFIVYCVLIIYVYYMFVHY